MDEDEKEICVKTMKEMMAIRLAQPFMDTTNISIQIPQIVPLIPNFESFPSILERVLSGQFSSIDQFSLYFEGNLKMLISCVANLISQSPQSKTTQELLALEGIAEEILRVFNETLSTNRMSEFERYKKQVLEINEKIEKLKRDKPSDYSDDKNIFVQVQSFNADPIPSKVFSI